MRDRASAITFVWLLLLTEPGSGVLGVVSTIRQPSEQETNGNPLRARLLPIHALAICDVACSGSPILDGFRLGIMGGIPTLFILLGV